MQEDKSKVDEVQEHLRKAAELERELSGADEGESTRFGELIYGIQLSVEQEYGGGE